LSTTIFEAASDAAAAVRWPIGDGAPADRRTQGRWLEKAAKLLGLDLGLDERTRERIASVLEVPLLKLRDRPTASWLAAGSWTDRGRAVEAILEQVREPTQLLTSTRTRPPRAAPAPPRACPSPSTSTARSSGARPRPDPFSPGRARVEAARPPRAGSTNPRRTAPSIFARRCDY